MIIKKEREREKKKKKKQEQQQKNNINNKNNFQTLPLHVGVACFFYSCAVLFLKKQDSRHGSQSSLDVQSRYKTTRITDRVHERKEKAHRKREREG